MNIKNLLGKLSIGRAGVSTGVGNIVRTGAPEDAYRSGVTEFIRKAQTEDSAPNEPLQKSTKPRMTHPVVLVSRFKYPYVKTKSIPGEEGEKPTKVETGELGWKSTPNKDVADENAGNLYAYELYLYEDTQTGQDLVIGQPIEEYLAKSKLKQNQPALDINNAPASMEDPEWYKAKKASGKKAKRVKTNSDTSASDAGDNYENEFPVNAGDAGAAGDTNAQDSDFSVDREIDSPESRYKFKGKITRFTTEPSNPEGRAAKLGANVVPAYSLGFRAYEVMPSPVAAELYVEPDGEDPSKVPTWIKSIRVPTEESPSAYGTSFRYRFSNGEPVPTLNGNKHVLSELLSVDGEKAPKDPGMNADFNIYEFMTANDLWNQMDNFGRLPSTVKTQIADAESNIQSSPELEHFTLGGGSLVNLGGKKDSIMSEENLLARALYHLRNPSVFTYVNTDGTEAFRPRVEDDKNIGPLANLDKQLHAARQAYRELYESLSPAERRASPELEEAADRANKIGIKFVDLMAAKYPSKLREFVLKQPYVGHAPAGDHNKPGGKHESVYSLSPDSHLSDKGRTLATYESGGGLQKLNDDDRKLYALVKSFERNADNSLNNQAKTLHSQKHAKLVESPSESGESYKIPTPRDASGEWSDAAGKSIDFMENHWLQNHLLSTEDRAAISELQNKLAGEGKQYTWGQVAIAYLKNQDRLKVKKFTQGSSMLASTDHFLSQGPFTFETPAEGGEDGETEFVTLSKFTPQSEVAEKLKNEVLKQHLFNKQEVDLAEYLAGKEPFTNEDDALFSIWANWLLRTKRSQASERAKKALAVQEAREKSKTENARGKPNGWKYPLTSQKFDDEERAEFAGNLEEFVNTIKNQAGAVIDNHRSVVYIKPDGSQVELPNALPVQLPAGAKMPMPTDKLRKIKDSNTLAKYGIVRFKDSLYSTANSKPVELDEDGMLVIGDETLPLNTLREMTPMQVLDNYRLFERDGRYYYVSEDDKIKGPIAEVVAQGGEKIALPADTLDERGLQLLVKYVEQTTGQRLEGGQVHAYESDNDKIKTNSAYTEMINNGASEKNAYAYAKKAVMRDKMNNIAVQCMSEGTQANPEHTKAANAWIPEVIKTLESKGNPQFIDMLADNYNGIDNLIQIAKSGQLDAEDAQQIVDEYNIVTGTTPQQGAYIKPMMQSVLMHGYQKESTPGLPNNKFWHMLMSNAGKRFLDIKLDTESGNDLASQAMLHLMEKPESPLEGADLSRVLPKSAMALLEKTLRPEERRMQRINPRYMSGARTAVESWQAKPLPRLLAEHADWLTKPHIFSQEMIEEAYRLAGTNMVQQEREKIFPDTIHATPKELKSLDYAVAMSIILQRRATQSEKHPQQDMWDIIMNEPGLDPVSPEWQAKHKLSQHEARVGKTADLLNEQSKLKNQLGINSAFDVDAETPAIQLSDEDADAIIDQPMIHALSTALVQSEDRDKIGVFGKANRALTKEARSMKSTHARGVVYPKTSIATQDTSPLMITDDSGKERDVTGYTPDDYEHITGEINYNDDEGLSPETLMKINQNTKAILSGGSEDTLLGQFRQKLNKELLSSNQIGMSRAARAELMYSAIYKMAAKYKHSVAENEEMLAYAKTSNPKAVKTLQREIEHDTNVLSMIESYDVFEHLSKMIYYGQEFGKLAEDIDGDYKAEKQLIEIAKKYDLEAREVWNFITRTTYMDKRNIAKLEALGLGMKIGESGALNESRLSQEDRDEVSSMVFDKLDKKTRWFESPVAAVPAVGGSDIHSKDPEQIEPLVNKEVRDIDSTELARFLARRGVMFASEMGKLDKLAGRQRTSNVNLDGDEAKVKYSQDFTQSKDLAWFVHNWLQNADVSDSVVEPGHDGLSTLDRAVGDLERLYAKPGGIYWSNTAGDYNALLEHAQPQAMAYSLLAKYVDQIAQSTGNKTDIEGLINNAASQIANDVDAIHKSVDYDSLDEETQAKINDAIAIAANSASNIGMKDRLKNEYTKSGNDGSRVYEGTNPRNFSNAKSAIAMQMANHHLVDDLVKRSSSNQEFVSDGSAWRFDPGTIAAYIAHTIGSEIVSSIKHLERPGDWELVGLSPMQALTGLKPGYMLTEREINAYINKRLDYYQNMLQSQWRVDTLNDLGEDNQSGQQVELIINKASDLLGDLVNESMGADGSINPQKPLSQTMRNLQTKSQLVTTAFQEDLDSKINDGDMSLKEFNESHVLPALLGAKPSDIRGATANAMRKWSTGESTWPVVTTAVKNHAGKNWRAKAEGESDEDYQAFLQQLAKKAGKSVGSLIGYGPSGVMQVDTSAIRDRSLAGKLHSKLSGQVARRLDYLRNPENTAKSYKSAVHDSQRSHFADMQKLGYYNEHPTAPTGTGDWSHGNIGLLNLDQSDEVHQALRQHQRGGRGKQVATPAAAPVSPEQANPVIAEAINKLVKLAAKLDAKQRFTEADFIDSLIHKIEVAV